MKINNIKQKIYVIGGSKHYSNWINDLGISNTDNVEEATLAMITGGEDLHPRMYNEPIGKRTYFTEARDEYEEKWYKYFREKGIPIIGTCRGGQFLTVKAGGKLVQHSSHPHMHKIDSIYGDLMVNSLHHQQFLIDETITKLKEGVDCKLIGWSNKISDIHLNGEDKDYNFEDNYKEPEIVWFPKIKGLAIQFHPEMLSTYMPAVKHLQDLVIKIVQGEEV